MFAWFKCLDCGLVFEFAIIRSRVQRLYKVMIEKGTLDPEAVRKGPFGREWVIMHPKYFHPYCPRCGGRSVWIFSKEARRRV